MSDRSESARRLGSVGGASETADHTTAALLVGAPEAARRLGISERALWRWTKCSAIPSVRVGRRVLYRPSALAAWIDAGAPTDPGAADRLGGGR